MRICVISQLYYGGAIRSAYDADGALAGRPFAEQVAAVSRMQLIRSDSYARGLAKLGHETWHIYSDIPPLLATWLRERGLSGNGTIQDQGRAAVLGQVREFAADAVIIQGLGGYPPDLAQAIRDHAPTVRIVAATEGSRIKPETLGGVDLLIVNLPALKEMAIACGKESVYLPHAFDPSVMERLPTDPGPPVPFAFTGSSGYGMPGTHNERMHFLKAMFEATDLQAWLWEGLHAHPDQPSGFPRPMIEMYPDRGHPAVFGLDMLSLLSRAEITLNYHADTRHAGNMRLFEATGMGTCLLTDDCPHMAELFEPGREVAIYRSSDEAIAWRNEFARHPSLRRSIAAAGRARTLADHTVDRRCVDIDRTLKRLL